MRAMSSVLLLWFAGVVGCATVESPPSEATSAGELAGGDSQSVICPHICGLGTQCRFPDGSCTEACNPCLCMAGGGKVVTSCRGKESSQDSLPQASTIADDSFVGGACGNTTCGKGSFCCNPSCSSCAPIGGVCTQQVCNPAE